MSIARTWLNSARQMISDTTEGPWRTFTSSSFDTGGLGVEELSGHMVFWHHRNGMAGARAADARFVAAARTLLPRAVEALEEVREFADAMRSDPTLREVSDSLHKLLDERLGDAS